MTTPDFIIALFYAVDQEMLDVPKHPDAKLFSQCTKSYKGTTHARAFNEKTPAAKPGCESCHGPGKEHVDAGGDKAKISI